MLESWIAQYVPMLCRSTPIVEQSGGGLCARFDISLISREQMLFLTEIVGETILVVECRRDVRFIGRVRLDPVHPETVAPQHHSRKLF